MSRINYDLSKIKAIAFDVDGVLSCSTIPMDSDAVPLRTMNIKDSYALQLAVKYGYHLAIITGGNTENVRTRYANLGLQDIYMAVAVKKPCLDEWMAKYNLKAEEVVYIGDDIPDMEVMKAVGLSVAPADAAEDIRAIAKYISPCEGGRGCARDVLEQIMRAQGKWLRDRKAFGW